jgi:hypothetical protein
MVKMPFFKSIQRVTAAACILALVACGNEVDRQETVTKLRTLGVAQTPVNAKPGDTVQLTYYLAGPSGLSITPSLMKDPSSAYGVAVLPTAVSTSVLETNYGSLSLYSYQAAVQIPSDNQVMIATMAAYGYARVRSMASFLTPTGDREDVVSDSLTYPAGSPALSWISPTLSIVSPASTATSGNLALEGSIEGATSETMRIAWFVSTGKVKNRRSKTTSWEEAAAGAQTVFFTARGSKSGAFAIKAMSVQVQ